MMNIQNQGSKEGLGVKFTDGVYADFCKKL